MGSFNATCIISNLPIEAGTPVRFFLLTGSRFHQGGNDHVCYVGGRWQLRGAAIRAKYNDYGSIEGIKDSLTTRALFEALSRDAVEKGVGDNQCHDVQVRPGMTQQEWLDALWEGRVFVQDATLRVSLPEGWKPEEPEEGVPSLTRLEKVLTDGGFPVVTAYGASGYVLDEVSRGFIRVRHGRHSENTNDLEAVLPALHGAGYAAMVTCGTGSYANHAEIVVAPKPALKGKSFFARQGLSDAPDELTQETPRPVSQVMVREDVWKILLSTPLDTYRGKYNLKRMKADALAWLKKRQEKEKAVKEAGEGSVDLGRLLFQLENDHFDRDNIFASSIHPSEGTSGYSLREAFRLGFELAQNQKDLEAYVLDLAEMAYVQWVYSVLHGQWHPTTNSGQEGNWKEHRAFLKKLLKIKGRWEDER